MKWGLGILVVIVLAGGVWFMLGEEAEMPVLENLPAEQNTNGTTQPTVQETSVGTADVSVSVEAAMPVQKTFTIAEIATYNSEERCYAAIRGIVYNLTAFIQKHPGGDRNILKICGKDGTAAFEGEHGGDPKPESTLAGFEVGVVAR